MSIPAVFIPPGPKTPGDKEKIRNAENRRKRGTPKEEFFFFKIDDRHYISIPDDEGVFSILGTRCIDSEPELLVFCARIKSCELYLFEVIEMEEQNSEYLFFNYKGKFHFSQTIKELIKKEKLQKLLTETIKEYYSVVEG